MRSLPFLLALLILIPSISPVAFGATISTSITSTTNLVPFLTPQSIPISAPSQGCFFGQSQSLNTTEVNYTFKPNGIIYWSNSLGSNISISSISLTVLGVTNILQIPQALMNSTSFNFPLSSGPLSANLYFSSLTNGCGGKSNQYSIKIVGNSISPSTLTFNIGNPKQLPVKCDNNNLKYFVGTEGIDFHDALAYSPSCNQTSVSFNLSGSFNIDPATVGTSNSNGNCGGTGCDNQLKLWEANGYYWYFYTNNAHWGYQSCLISSGNCGTSAVNWGAFTTVSNNAGIGDCSTNINASIATTYLYYACSTGSNSFIIDSGTLGSGGTFSCSHNPGTPCNALTVTTLQSQTGYPYIAANSNSSVWVAVKSYDGTNEHIEVWSCQVTNCIGNPAHWANSLDENDAFGNNDAHPNLGIIHTGGSTYIELTWGYDGNSINHALSIRWTTNYGTSWQAAINSACNIDAMGYSQVTQNNGTLYIIAVQSGAAGCTQAKDDYIRWDYGSASITYETKNAFPGGGGNDGVGISSNGASSVSVIYETSSTTIVYNPSTNAGNTFSGAVGISSAETFSSIDFTPTISPTCDSSNNVMVGWSSGGGAPFNVRFALYTGCTAASVTQPINISTSPSGAPSGTITISGCAASNSTFTANGFTKTYTGITASCTITLTTSGVSGNTRYEWNISPHPTAGTTLTFTTCSTGTCSSYTNTTYYQLQNTYTANPSSPTTWDGIYTWSISGTYLGTGSTSISCTNTANGGGAVSCSNAWYDYDLIVSFPSQIGNTWKAQAPSSFMDSTGGNTDTVNYIQSSGTTSNTSTNWLWLLTIPFFLSGIVILRKRKGIKF